MKTCTATTAVLITLIFVITSVASAHLASEQAPGIEFTLDHDMSVPLHPGHDGDIYKCGKSVIRVVLGDNQTLIALKCKDGQMIIKLFKDLFEYLLWK